MKDSGVLLGPVLRSARRRAGLTVDELAAALGTLPEAVRAWEGGAVPSPGVIVAMSRVLGLDVDQVKWLAR